MKYAIFAVVIIAVGYNFLMGGISLPDVSGLEGVSLDTIKNLF